MNEVGDLREVGEEEGEGEQKEGPLDEWESLVDDSPFAGDGMFVDVEN
jgi:hypothetical protein